MSPRRIVLVLSLALVLAGCGDTFRTAAAIVDDEKITDAEVQRQLDLALADPQASAQLGTGPEREARIKDAARLTLSILIQEQLVEDYARAQEIEVSEEVLEQALADTVRDAGGEEAFAAELEARGLTVADVQDNLHRRLLIEAVAADLAQAQVSEAELREAYDTRINEYTQVHLSHILVSSQEEAEAIRATATPQSFARIAREASEDTASGPQGGDLGTLTVAELPQPLADAVIRVPVGRVSGPVLTEAGYSVFIVHEREQLPFSEVREALLEERQNDVFNAWLADRIRNADIRVNPRYGRLDTASGRVVAFTSTDTNAPPEIQLTP